MDNIFLELIFYIVVFLIYFIFGGNRIRLGNTELFQDFDLESDSLAAIRYEYNERLKRYYKHYKPQLHLINKYCEAKFLNDKKGNISFYVKERAVFDKQGRYFEVNGDNAHTYTMWGIINMEFNELTRYDDIKDLYKNLNQGYDTRGGMKYYKEPVFRKLPKPVKKESAQNEFCRMEIKRLTNERMILVCSEIWGSLDYKNTREFVIIANKSKLFYILKKFSEEKNKMQNYFTLLAKCAARTDIKIEEMEKQQKEEVRAESEQKLNQPEQALNPNEVQYLHNNIETTLNEEYKKQQEKHRKINSNDVIEEFSEETEKQKKRYNERKLDF